MSQADSKGASHTPGPWFVNELDHCSIHGPDMIGICDLRHKDGGPRRNSEANARLIAAAPELLAYAICQEEWDRARRDGNNTYVLVLVRHGWRPAEEPANDFLERLQRAAIAKAEGR